MSSIRADQHRPGAIRVLADLVPGAVSSAMVREVALVVGGAAFTGLAAQISIPLPGTPVPLTLQTFAVLVVGAALGWRRGLLSLALYAGAGLAGVPWFADGASGWALASMGYVLGFVFAAALVGWLAERGADRRVVTAAVIMVLGNLVIYVCGVSVLMSALDVDLRTALSLGVTPFLLTDGIKIALAAGVLPAAWRLVGRSTGRGN
jgi:biotin transport system substrate-specific component